MFSSFSFFLVTEQGWLFFAATARQISTEAFANTDVNLFQLKVNSKGGRKLWQFQFH